MQVFSCRKGGGGSSLSLGTLEPSFENCWSKKGQCPRCLFGSSLPRAGSCWWEGRRAPAGSREKEKDMRSQALSCGHICALWSLVFTDSVCQLASLLFVTPVLMLVGLWGHSQTWCRSGKTGVTWCPVLPAEAILGHPLLSCSRSRAVSKCPLCSLVSATFFYTVVCCRWFCCLSGPPM